MYEIITLEKASTSEVQSYWQDLIEADTLKYRLSDINCPQLDDVLAMMYNKNNTCFYVRDQFRGIVADFMFENFKGESAQVHFSMNPNNPTQENVFLAETTTYQVLNNWKKRDSDEPYLTTIYGVTPTCNRVATMFIYKAGFKKVGIIPRSIVYFGKISDALITIKEREEP